MSTKNCIRICISLNYYKILFESLVLVICSQCLNDFVKACINYVAPKSRFYGPPKCYALVTLGS